MGKLLEPLQRRRPRLENLDRADWPAGLALLWRDRALEELEAELLFAGLVLLDDHADVAAALQLAEQHFIGERLLDVFLDHAGHRPRTHLLVITTHDQPVRRGLRQLDGDVA